MSSILEVRAAVIELGEQSARNEAAALEEGRRQDASFYEGEIQRTIEVLILLDRLTD